jgi:hypothetical protein
MVRAYLLTEREKKIMREYVENGTKLEGFSEVCRRVEEVNMDRIKDDAGVLGDFLKVLKGCEGR